MAKRKPQTSKEFRKMYPKKYHNYTLTTKLPISSRCQPFHFVGNPTRPRASIYMAKRKIPSILDATAKRKMFSGFTVYKKDPIYFDFFLMERHKETNLFCNMAARFKIYVADRKAEVIKGHELLLGRPQEKK